MYALLLLDFLVSSETQEQTTIGFLQRLVEEWLEGRIEIFVEILENNDFTIRNGLLENRDVVFRLRIEDQELVSAVVSFRILDPSVRLLLRINHEWESRAYMREKCHSQ